MRRPWILLAWALLAPAASASQLEADVEALFSHPFTYIGNETIDANLTVTYRAAGIGPQAGIRPSGEWRIDAIPSWLQVVPAGGGLSFASGHQANGEWRSTLVVPVSISVRQPRPPEETSASLDVVVHVNATATHRGDDFQTSFTVSMRREFRQGEAGPSTTPAPDVSTPPPTRVDAQGREPSFVLTEQEPSAGDGFSVPGPLTSAATTAIGGWAGWRLSRRFG
ncbi:MAG TPA: hypothetical protein VHH36_07855 [Candidatus Thermoplasmatota archaeon]|nr:hypothetical protein [Candidatus Thermoplasmatota archaeon]